MLNKTITLIICTTLLLTGCGTQVKNNAKVLNYFETDMYTQSVNIPSDVKEEEKTEYVDEDLILSTPENTDIEYENFLSEVTLIGDDTSISYEILNGTDIEYRGTVFTELYSNMQYINTKYDKNTLLNFIIKTYNAKSSEVYTMLTVDSNETYESDIYEPTIDESLSGTPKYDRLKFTHDEPVTWTLDIVDSETMTGVKMYGAYNYLLVRGDGIDVTIDMSKYDSGIQNDQTSVDGEDTQVDETEDISSDEGEDTESNEKNTSEESESTEEIDENTSEENTENIDDENEEVPVNNEDTSIENDTEADVENEENTNSEDETSEESDGTVE